MKGKAVVFEDRMTVAVREVDIPEPQADEVVIDVELSWISNGTESSFLRGERIGGDTPYYEGGPWPFPIVAGYQKVGTVRSVGADVTELRPGERVFATVSRVAGMYNPFGGHVSPAVTPAGQVWKLPPGIEPADCSGLVLTQVGYNCGVRPPVRGGERVVVLGDGMVGQWAAQTLHRRGAAVLVAGRRDERLDRLPAEIARANTRTEAAAMRRDGDESGAAGEAEAGPLRASRAGAMPPGGLSAQGEGEALAAAASRFAGKDGIAVVVDTVGDMDAVYRLLPLMSRDSHIVSAGFYGHEGGIDIQKLRDKEITLHAPAGWTRPRMDATLEGIRAGWLRTGTLVTHRFSVDRAAEAWRMITEKTEPHLGIILEWQPSGGFS